MTEALLASKILLDPTFDIMTPLDVTMNSSVIQVAKNANFSIFFEYFQIMKSVKSYIKDVRPAPPGGSIWPLIENDVMINLKVKRSRYQHFRPDLKGVGFF